MQNSNPEQVIDLNPTIDQLAVMEQAIRGDGLWCRKVGQFDLRHMMICKREKSSIAISRCGQLIVPFDKLVEDSTTKKCLVCSLYDEAGEEAKLKAETTLARLVDEMQSKP